MVTQHEYIIYTGVKFTVEWYYSDKGGSEVKAYFESLSPKRQDKFLYLVKRIADHGKIFNKQLFNNEYDEIYAFKPQPDRFLSCFVKGHKIVVLSAFEKKTQKLPKQEKKKALKLMKDYESRVKGGTYYE